MDVEKDVSENVAPPQEYGILSPKTAFVVDEPTDIVQQITLFVHSHQCISILISERVCVSISMYVRILPF